MGMNPSVVVCVVGLVSGASLWAQDWPQWRGPSRDGVAKIRAPRTWPEKLTTKWKVEVCRSA